MEFQKRPQEQNISKLTDIKTFVQVLTHSQMELFITVNFVSLCGIICLVGLVANAINIIVFLKQGFINTVNISLFGLAISDLCCLLTLLWMGMCLNPLIVHAGAPWVPTEFVYLTGAWPHNISGRITSYITVYVTAERCLCIIFPMKVKQLITPTRTAVAVCLIYFLNILTLFPEYITSYFAWKFFPDSNRTLLALAYSSGREKTARLVFFLNSISGVTSFVAVIVFTTILVTKLRKASLWRSQITSSNDGHGEISNRDKKTVKMIAVIAIVLIVCFIPGAIVSMVTFIEPEFDLGKKYVNIVISMWSIVCVFQSANSSVNIILYYKMSSKYRHTLGQVFKCCKRTDTTKVYIKVTA